MDNIDGIKEQVGNVNRDKRRKYQKEVLGIKNRITEMKNVFDGPGIAEERIFEVYINKILKKQIEDKKKTPTKEHKNQKDRLPKDCRTTVKGVPYMP